MVLATVLLLPIYLLRRKRSERLTRSDRQLILISGLFLATHFAVWITALSYTSIASATVLVTIQPLFLTILAQWILKERVDKWGYLAIACALIGAATIGWGDFQISKGQLFGDLLALSGGLFAACYLLVGRSLVGKLGLINYIFPVYAVSAVALIFTLLLSVKPLLPENQIDYLWFVLLALVPTLLGHTFYNYALKRLKAHLVGITILGEPILASIYAMFLFGVYPTIATILGSLLIFCAIVFSFRHATKVSP